MRHSLFDKFFLKAGVLIVLCITVLISTAKAGLDYYEIFIGKQLIYKRAMNEPLNLKSLPLSQAYANEQLVIHYYQCNAPNKTGSKRSIILKDENGNVIKEWKFADVGGSGTAMIIPVKELLQLQKTSKSKQLSIFYTAEGRAEGQKIALISGNSKLVGSIYKKQNDFVKNVGAIIYLDSVKPKKLISLKPLYI